MKAYLEAHGFKGGEHRMDPEAWQTLKIVAEHFHRIAPIMPGVMKLADALEPCGEGGYYVMAAAAGRAKVAPEILAALKAFGWIYYIDPETTYFEVSNGTLWAKYQTILGQVPLVKVRP